MIINRLGLNDLIEPINKQLEFQLQDPFLLYRTAKGEIHMLLLCTHTIVFCIYKVSSVMGHDDSYPATVPSVVPTGDPTDPFTTFSRPTAHFSLNK